MDPLSITASIITLVQATVRIAKGVQFIRSLGQIPAEFCDLLNELSTLQAVASQAETALRDYETQQSLDRSSASFATLDSSVLTALQGDLAQITTDLEVLCDELKKKNEKAKSIGQEQISTRKWLKGRKNILKLREKARDTRQNLSLCFAAFTSSQVSRQVKLSLSIQEVLCSWAEDISQLKIQNGSIQEQNQKLFEVLQRPSNQEHNRTADKKETRTRPSIQTATTPMVYFRAASLHSCLHICTCACHKMRHSQSPTSLKSTFGSLFLHYNTIPFFQRANCDVSSCKVKSRSSLRLYYAFPQWLIARSIEFTLSWSSITGAGSSLHLRVPRVNPHLDYIYRTSAYNDIRYIQVQIAEKYILPTDVTEFGGTLVQLLLQWGSFEAARFLMQQGFDISSKDIYGRSAAIDARKMYLELLGSSVAPKSIINFFERFLEDLSLQHNEDEPLIASPIHRAILEADNESLATIVAQDISDLDTIDSFGYAPIHWVAERGDADAVRILLDAGARPDILAATNLTPLALAVRSKSIETAQLLLDYGVDVKHHHPISIPPMYYAIKQPKMLRLLLEHGALANDTIGGYIYTPLDYAADYIHNWGDGNADRTSLAESVDCLISAGVDLNNRHGGLHDTTILKAVWNRNHLLLDLLIDAGARLDLTDTLGRGILHEAAMFIDIRSVEVLRRARISGIDPDRPDNEGYTPLAYVYRRLFRSDTYDLRLHWATLTNDEFWAFKQLIDEIRTRNEENKRRSYTDPDRDERVYESSTEWETVSVDSYPIDVDSEYAQWGSSVHTWSDCSDYSESGSESSDSEEFFDAEE